MKQTKRKDNNIPEIGIYKNTNIKVVILKGNYIINKREESHHSSQNKQEEKVPLIPQGIKNNYVQIEQNNQQVKNNIIRKEVENLIYIMIDMKNINKKVKEPLAKDKNYEKLYPINIQWLSKYMEYYKLYNLYTNDDINQLLDNIINDKINLSSADIFLNAKIQLKFFDIINNFSKNISDSNFNKKKQGPTKIEISDIFYYSNFILISEQTFKLLSIDDNKPIFFYCYFGDNKIFVVNNGPNKFLIEVYYLEENKNILPEIFYKFSEGELFSNCLSLILEKGYHEFLKYHLMFNGDKSNMDLTSPIFNQNNKEIGYAYKYNPNIKDYTPYIINNEYKTMVKLFFHYKKFNSKSIMQNSGKNYLLLNSKFIKRYKDHSL